MAKNKDQNQSGTFEVKQTGSASRRKKIARNFVTALTAVIFIFGIGLAIFKHTTKPTKQSDTATAVPSVLPDWWLQKYFASATCNTANCQPNADPDNDGLTNAQEFYYHTDPLNPYTVKDTLNDGQLVAAGFDPSRSGRMTFDQVTAPDNILGESLAVGQDLQTIEAQQNDINNVALPLVADDQLNVTADTSQTAYANYSTDLQTTINKYFTQSDLDNIKTVLQSGTGASIDDIKTKSALLATDLQAMTVPAKMLMYHKYLLAFFQLLPKVLLSDGDPGLDGSSPASDVWYQNAQALFATTQKLNDEEKNLGIQSPVTP